MFVDPEGKFALGSLGVGTGAVAAGVVAYCTACMASIFSEYKNSSGNDKYKHCMVGADGARKCGKVCAYLAAYGKEIADAAGYGTPDINDARATTDGANKCSIEDEDCEKNKQKRCCNDVASKYK